MPGAVAFSFPFFSVSLKDATVGGAVSRAAWRGRRAMGGRSEAARWLVGGGPLSAQLEGVSDVSGSLNIIAKC